MSKRRNLEDDHLTSFPSPKRARISESHRKPDYFARLSNEILLHILSFLSIPTLLTCQRLSHRFYTLAGDSELWKRKYYTQWVRPRARRLANVRRGSLPLSKFEYSPKVSTWLDHGHLDRTDKATNWKRQYQLRHNWSKGVCRVTQVDFPQPPQPPMLITFCAGFVFTADSHSGLRAWPADNPKSCFAKLPFTDIGSNLLSPPTTLTAASNPQRNSIEVAVGFEAGYFNMYRLDITESSLQMRFSRTGRTDGAITAMASSFPYLLMVSEHKLLSLYRLSMEWDGSHWQEEAHLLASLKADSILEPMSLSVRTAGSQIISSIVYSFFHIGCGWSLGIQELRFNTNGQQIESRLTTTVDSQYGTIPWDHLSQSRKRRHSALGNNEEFTGELFTTTPDPSILHQNPPTSVSYSHPYLLASHADNTLTVYQVVSTSESLFVKGGQRLWGHTSSVLAVQVSDRGKAVSVSSHGDEIRIWELEGLISSFGSQKVLHRNSGIRVHPGNQEYRKYEGLGLLAGVPRSETKGAKLSPGNLFDTQSQMCECIGFDEERVLLLRERAPGAQLLEFYDFT